MYAHQISPKNILKLGHSQGDLGISVSNLEKKVFLSQ